MLKISQWLAPFWILLLTLQEFTTVYYLTRASVLHTCYVLPLQRGENCMWSSFCLVCSSTLHLFCLVSLLFKISGQRSLMEGFPNSVFDYVSLLHTNCTVFGFFFFPIALTSGCSNPVICVLFNFCSLPPQLEYYNHYLDKQWL